jgi:hypothetical protein
VQRCVHGGELDQVDADTSERLDDRAARVACTAAMASVVVEYLPSASMSHRPASERIRGSSSTVLDGLAHDPGRPDAAPSAIASAT